MLRLSAVGISDLQAGEDVKPCAQRTEIAYSVAAADNRALNPSAVRWSHIFVIVR